MREYFKPFIKTYDSKSIADDLGMVQTSYDAAINVYGGRTASLNNNLLGEYRLVKSEMDYGIIKYKEVNHA